MIIAGIGSLIQIFPLWKIGSGLPKNMDVHEAPKTEDAE